MRFAWDEKKAASNLSKHGISFEEAATVFGDPLSDTFPDPDHSLERAPLRYRRFFGIKILVVAHTDDGELVRIISARGVTHGERNFYEES